MSHIKSIGKHTYGHEHILTHSWGEGAELHIGAFCSIAKNCQVYLGGNHRVDWITTYPFGHHKTRIFNKFNGIGHPTTKGDVVIGNDVWIGANVTIMSGIKIADGAVIANNSHVVKDVPAYMIVGGNPAKNLRQRFDDRTVEKLLKIKWWNWDDSKINDNSPLLCSNELTTFLEKFQE